MDLIDRLINLPVAFLNHWGYWIVFLAAMLEAIPFVGAIVPGHTIIVAGGLLAQQGILALSDVLILAALGAIVGDLGGYLIGRKYGYQSLARFGRYFGRHFYFKPEQLEKAKRLVQENPGKTLVIGRFSPVTRALAPFAAGSSDVKFSTFIFFNILGSSIWAAASVMIGYIFGAGYDAISKIIGRFIFIGIFLIILAILGYRFINKKEYIFEKYHLHTFAISLSFLFIFSRMLDAVNDNDWLTGLDVLVHNYIQSWWPLPPAFTGRMIDLSYLTRPAILIAISFFLLLFLLYKKRWYHSILLGLSLSGGFVLVSLIKIITERLRPATSLIASSGFSFPSAHATLTTIICLLIIYSFRDQIEYRSRRWLLAIINIIIILTVAFNRVYLGAHWLSDVLGGISLGVVLVTMFILLIRLIIYTFESGIVAKIKGIILKSAKRY